MKIIALVMRTSIKSELQDLQNVAEWKRLRFGFIPSLSLMSVSLCDDICRYAVVHLIFITYGRSHDHVLLTPTIRCYGFVGLQRGNRRRL